MQCVPRGEMEEPQEKARTCAHNGKCFPPSSLPKVAKWASALTLQLVLKKRGGGGTHLCGRGWARNAHEWNQGQSQGLPLAQADS